MPNFGGWYGEGRGDGDGYGDGCGWDYGHGWGGVDGYGVGHASVPSNGYIVDHTTPIVAYYCARDDGHRVAVGTVHEKEVDPELWVFGLRASLTVEDALRRGPGVLTRVACSGYIAYGHDMLICTRREVLEVLG